MLSVNVNITEIAVFLSILLRLSVILFMLPIFNASGVPAVLKPLTVIALTVMLFPVVRQNIEPIPLELAAFASVIIGELIYGIIVALSMSAIFAAFELAGEMIGFEMGFGFAQTADPLTGSRFAVLAIWLNCSRPWCSSPLTDIM